MVITIFVIFLLIIQNYILILFNLYNTNVFNNYSIVFIVEKACIKMKNFEIFRNFTFFFYSRKLLFLY